MRYQFLLAFTFFFGISTASMAQEFERYFLRGVVQGEDGSPIPDVKIKVSGKRGSTTTDSTGFYSVYLRERPERITFSHIGFHTYGYNVPKAAFEKDNALRVDVVLNQKVNQLRPFELSDKGFEIVYKQPLTSVLDYELLDTSVVLLVKERRDYEIRWMNMQNEMLIQKGFKRVKPKSLIKDCMGNIHIKSVDSVYQLAFSTEDIELVNVVPEQLYQQVLQACVLETDAAMVLKEYGPHNQSVLYSMYSKTKRKKEYLHRVRDEQSEYFAATQLQENSRLRSMGADKLGETKQQVHAGRDLFESISFYKSILSKPVYHPLFEMNDSLVLFDHLNEVGRVFSMQGMEMRTFPLKHQKLIGWNNQIHQDLVTGDFYAECVINGITSLHQIDAKNGNIVKKMELEENTFVKELKVKNKVAYYLFRKPYDFEFQHLYRQRL